MKNLYKDSKTNNIDKLNSLMLSNIWDNICFEEECFSEGVCLEKNTLPKSQKEFIYLLIDLIPEWKRLLKCEQHKIHDFCLDIHTLQVVKKIQIDSDFLKLNDENKLVLLYSAYLHDIEKEELKVDPLHPEKGAETSTTILYRLGFDDDFINKVYFLIRNHQIIGLYAANRLQISINELFEKFKDRELLGLLVMLTIADIKSVKRDEMWFYDEVKDNVQKIKDKLKGK